MSLNIAILGGTSHIARAITPYLLESGAQVTLFARNPGKLADSPCRVIGDFAELMNGKYDLLINCIGAGTPKELAGDYNRWFTVLEKFDNLALEYLQKVNRQALYVMFSSGAVYGRKNLAPAEENSVWELSPNKIAVPDYYALAKIYSEAKHRSLPDLRIADLRIFSFFRKELFPFQTFSATSRASFPVIRIMEIAPPGAVHNAAAVSSFAESFFEKIVIIFRLSLEKNPVEIIIMRIILAHKT